MGWLRAVRPRLLRPVGLGQVPRVPTHHHDRATHDHHGSEHDIDIIAYLNDDGLVIFDDAEFNVIPDSAALYGAAYDAALYELVKHPDVIAAYHRVHDRGAGDIGGGDLDDLRVERDDLLDHIAAYCLGWQHDLRGAAERWHAARDRR